jgi:hypothetical protein
VENDANFAVIRARLADAPRRTLPSGSVTVPVLPLDSTLGAALGSAYRTGRLVLGVEAVAKVLAGEARGLAAAADRAGSGPPARVSRLLLVSRDGAERLYRQVERLAREHAGRLLVVMLGCDAGELGLATTGRAAEVKVVLAGRKETVGALLRAITGSA